MANLQQTKRMLDVQRGKLANVEAFIGQFDAERQSLREVSSRLKQLETIEAEYSVVSQDLLANDEEENAATNVNQVVEFGERVEVARGRLVTLLQEEKAEEPKDQKPPEDDRLIKMMGQMFQMMSTKSEPSVSVKAAGKLPPLKFKQFDGKTEDYVGFRDTFDSVIAGHDLTDAAKYWYLSQNLSKEPLTMISSLENQPNAYVIAREQLDKRYNQKRLLVNNHLRALFNVSQMKDDTSQALRHLVSETQKQIRCLETQELPVAHWGVILIHLVTAKLHSVSRGKIEEKMPVNQLPEWKSFIKYLEERCEVLESMEQSKQTRIPSNTPVVVKPEPVVKPKKLFAYATTIDGETTALVTPSSMHTPKKKDQGAKKSPVVPSSPRKLRRFECAFCKNRHQSHRCFKYLEQPIEKRWELAKSKDLCLNCFKSGHHTEHCRNPSCSSCGEKHHETLHSFQCKEKPSVNMLVRSKRDDSGRSSAMHAHGGSSDIHVLLATAMVSVIDKKGEKVPCRVLLDSCSQSNFITLTMANTLRIPSKRLSISIKGIGNSTMCASRYVELEIKSNTTDFSSRMKFIILSTITEKLPPENIDIKSLQIPSEVTLADPEFHIPAEVDMLIGAELFYKILGPTRIDHTVTTPILQETVFGYIAAGKFLSNEHEEKFSAITMQTTYESLERQIKKFWQWDELESEEQLPSREEKACEEFFVKTTRRDATGRYIVRLPKKQSDTALGDSLHSAMACMRSLERRFALNPKLREMYVSFMQEYEVLGHMSEVPLENSQNNKILNYIPHIPVLRLENKSTKLRTVFNASTKTTSGKSLNDILMVGGTIQCELWEILNRFRLSPFVFVADLAKMYRQMRIHPDDADLQRIVWRENQSQPMKAYRLNTVTYGTSSASFLATRCLKQLAIDEGHAYPEAVSSINDFYMDDIMTGDHTEEKLLNKQKALIQMLATAGLSLHKWGSNVPSVLDYVKQYENIGEHSICDGDNIKTLGLHWNTVQDHFFFKVQAADKPSSTKRAILADISKLFDPLGLVGPVIVTAKIIMRELWERKLGWDVQVPEDVLKIWIQFRNALPALNKLTVDRWLKYDTALHFEIHGFCDASETAYGAVIYFRTVDGNGGYHSNLMCAKSRIAPLKTDKIRSKTIPRLELRSALLLAQLLQKTIKAIAIPVKEIRLWSDSTIALGWINTNPAKLQPFVGNRVEEIQPLTKGSMWHHVAGVENPADLISRGLMPDQLIANNRWFCGPQWLKEEIDYAKHKVHSSTSKEFFDEMKTTATFVSTTLPCSVIHRFSSANKVIKTVAIWKRFANNCRAAVKMNKGSIDSENTEILKLDTHPLTPREMDSALMFCVKRVQQECFGEEIQDLQNNRCVNKSKSKLAALVPFLDKDGVIRARGRLQKSQLEENTKHPIILPPKHQFTIALARQTHLKHHHAPPNLLLSLLRQKFWPLKGRELCRHVVCKCIACYKMKPKPIQQLMGSLPSARVQPARPFVNTGVDIAGPIKIKASLLRKAPILKAYIAIFVCMSTKAIHIEAINDLSTNAFIAALRRFMARRGKCAKIFSDNGRNFVGADRELKEFFEWLASSENQRTIASTLSSNNVQWVFNPPYAPHRGGLWEAGVKSIKHHLRRTIGITTLTFEEISTLLCEIEAILNSRPLTALPSGIGDLRPLTPGDFLIGHELSADIDPNLLNNSLPRHARWKLIHDMKTSFWNRWQKEYLPSLQAITNQWRSKPVTVNLGDLALIQDDNAPVGQWPLGKITKLLPGRDGVTRTVHLLLKGKIVVRSVQRLCVLPIDEDKRSLHGPAVTTLL